MIMTHSQLRAAAPAAFSTAHPMTGAYSPVNTTKVLARMADEGYVPVQASQDRPTSRDPRFVTHRIVLRHESQLGDESEIGEHVPQIMLVNSHNGRTKMRLFGGLYRFICANGLVVGDDRFRAEVTHRGDAASEAARIAEDVAHKLTDLRSTIDRWSRIEMPTGTAMTFARKAAALRFGEISGKSYDAAALLTPRRERDEGRSLWRLYNTIQENTTKAGLVGRTAMGRQVTTRELRAIGPDIKYNSALWALAESYAGGMQ